MVARRRFELLSAGPKPAMLGRYTTGLRRLVGEIVFNLLVRIKPQS